MTRKASKATEDAFYSMFGPFAVANFLMLVVLILAATLQPKVSDPSTHWVSALMAVIMVAAGVFVIRGGMRLKKSRASAREDRRRIAAGLPLDTDDPEDAKENQPDSSVE